MNKKSGIFGGVVLILLGLIFLASEIYPEVFSFWSWPFILIGLGLMFLLWALITQTGGLAVPGSILSGLGGIFYYQEITQDWASWSYIWALIPGFVGVGILLNGLIDRKFRQNLSGGLTLILISAIMFFAFGSQFGLQSTITMYWPVLLIALGAVALVRSLLRNNKQA
jgi:hypothetical protein